MGDAIGEPDLTEGPCYILRKFKLSDAPRQLGQTLDTFLVEASE